MNNQYQVVNYEEVNQDGSNDILNITIKAKVMKTSKGVKFNSIKAYAYMRYLQPMVNGKPCYVFDKDTKVEYIDKGMKMLWVDLSFTLDAFKTDCYEGCIIKDINDLKTGSLYVNANYVDKPNVFKITPMVDEEGKQVFDSKGKPKMNYPTIWIRGGLIGFQKYKPTQDSFSYHPNENVIDGVVDEATGEVVTDDSSNEAYTEEN